MSAKNIANSPAFAAVNAQLDRASGLFKKVPLKYWRTGLTALALFWVVHTLANVFWLILPAPDLPVAPVTPASLKVESSNSGKSYDIESVQALNLLGDYNAEPVATVEPEATTSDEPLEKTKLNVELQGVIAADDPKKSWAIIGKGSTQKLYKIDDELEGFRGVRLKEIYERKVVLNNNGNPEELWLYGEDGTAVASSYTPPPAAPSPRNEPQRATVSQEQISQAKNIGDVVRFMVATENGKMIGYKVRPGRQRELFDQVGLQTDDIVVSVNGIEVNEPQKVREVYQALKTATEANLQVMREGTLHSITITMSQ